MISDEQDAVEALAERVFGSHQKALDWLQRGNKRLYGRAPVDILHMESGAELVKQMLYQIDEGIFV